MTTGQAQVTIKDQGSLDLSGVTANAGLYGSASLASSVNGQDIYPLSVTTDHLYASNAVIYGILKAGSVYVGSGGVTISSEEDGATPTTGVFISSSQIILKSSGVDVVTLDGTDGSFTLQSAASGARIVIYETGLECYNSGGTKTVDLGSDGTFVLQSASSGARIAIDATGIECYDSSAVKTVDIGADGSFVLQTAASGERLSLSASGGLVIYDSNEKAAVALTAGGLSLTNRDGVTPNTAERINFIASDDESSVAVIWAADYNSGGIDVYRLNLALKAPGGALPLPADEMAQISLQAGSANLWLADNGVTGAATCFIEGSLSADNFDSDPHSGTWTADVTATGSMTATGEATTVSSYAKVGPYVFFNIRLAVNLGGSASYGVYISLPIDAWSAAAFQFEGGFGRSSDGTVVWGGDGTNADKMLVALEAGGNFTLGSSRVFRLSGFYRWV